MATFECDKCGKPIEEKDLALIDGIEGSVPVCRACYEQLIPKGPPHLADDSRGNVRLELPDRPTLAEQIEEFESSAWNPHHSFAALRKMASRRSQAIAELVAEALIRGADRVVLADLDRPVTAFRGVPIEWVPELPADGRGEPVYRAPAPIQARDGMSRNKPCFCGSGKKYKHCHLRK